MRRIPRPLAKRIDRLAARAHRFHRYAHHPLCGAYEAELVRLGRRTRVCRGCAYSALGAVCGAAVGFASPVGWGSWWAAAGLALSAWVPLYVARVRGGATSQPRAARPSKLWTRFAPAAAALCALALGLRRLDAHGIALASVTLAACAAYYVSYRKRGPDRSPCVSCPERVRPVCSGYAPIVRRERALQRVAGRMISA